MGTMERARDRGRRQARRLQASLGIEFRDARIAAGLSQSWVARVTGLSQTKVSRTERATVPLSMDDAALVAAALGLRLSVKAYPAGSWPHTEGPSTSRR